MQEYKKFYLDIDPGDMKVEWLERDLKLGYKINPLDNSLSKELLSVQDGGYYIAAEDKDKWSDSWVGIYHSKEGVVKQGTWFMKGYNTNWIKGDYIGNVTGRYPSSGVQDGFWYEIVESQSNSPSPSLSKGVFLGGYVGKKSIQALYRGSELVWRVKSDYPDYYEWATDDDFEEITGYTPARFKYIGSKDYVILPQLIHGKEYEPHEMFMGTAVKGVASKHDLQGSAFSMFEDSTSEELELIYLKTGNITNMGYMFGSSKATSLDLSSFNTSKVTRMSSMFRESEAASLDLSSFNTSKVTSMQWMFRDAKATKGYARTQTDADKFNNSSNKPDRLVFVVSLPSYYIMAEDSDFEPILGKTGRFRYIGKKEYIILPKKIQGEDFILADMFDGTLIHGVAGRASRSGSAWKAFANTTSPLLELKYLDTSNITSMQAMFSETSAKEIQTSFFDTSNVTNMSFMFNKAESLTSLDLSSFDTSNVTTMRAMFQSTEATSIIGLENFNTSNVTDMRAMFNHSNATTLNLSSFDTSNVTDMSVMFQRTEATEIIGLENFNTSNVTNMGYMFNYSNATILDLSSFDTSNVTDMGYMFQGVKATTLDLSSFNTSNVETMHAMFRDSSATTGYARTQADADKFNNSSNKPDGLVFVVNLPSYYELATDDDFRRIDTGRYRYIGSKDYIVLPKTIQGEKFRLENMFRNSSIKGVAGKASMEGDAVNAFHSSKSTELELKYLDTSNITSMWGMFDGSQATTLDLSSFDTSNVTDMGYMFENSRATILDLSSFDTSNVTNMWAMFKDSQATILDLSSFDTSNITSIWGMFKDSSATTGYARTQDDADKFNNSSEKPDRLTFVVKE